MVKDDLAYVEHILDCIRKIKEFSEGLSFKEFSANELVQDAVIRNIEIIGEASKKISADTKQIYYEIPWKVISGMRDKLIHDYLGVDVEVVWRTIKEDIPKLEIQIKEIELDLMDTDIQESCIVDPHLFSILHVVEIPCCRIFSCGLNTDACLDSDMIVDTILIFIFRIIAE